MTTTKPEPEITNAPAGATAKEEQLAAARPVVTGNEHCCIAQYFAVVERDGSLVRGHNVWRATRLALGIYEVFFTGDLSAGAFQATIGRPGIFTEPTGEICMALRYTVNPLELNKGVWVQTFDSAGRPSDRAFHLLAVTAG